MSKQNNRQVLAKTHRFRVILVAFVSMLVYAGIIARLYHVQINRHDELSSAAGRQQDRKEKLSPRRGNILDSNGLVLATSTFYDTVYFQPSKLKKGRTLPPELAGHMARLLGTSEQAMARYLAKKRRTLIKRKIHPEDANSLRYLVDDLDLPGGLFEYEKMSKRLYPQGPLAGPLVGFTTFDDEGDNVGLEGLEKRFDETLRGKQTEHRTQVNSWRQGLDPMDEAAMLETYGHSLVLTIDSQIQHYAEKALNRRVGEVQAKEGVAVVMDIRTGRILAMANCPDFDPNDRRGAKPEQFRNRALTDPIEIGSVMKILTATILIDNGLLGADEIIDCEGADGWGVYHIHGRRIKDEHAMGKVPFRQAFSESSNIAIVKLGQRLEPALYHEALTRFGLGQATGIEMGGESSGTLYPLSKWTKQSRVSLPMGYETTMTAVQVVSAVSAIANEGRRMKPQIIERIIAAGDGGTIKKFKPLEVGRVASAETCRTIIELMEGVVVDGTGTAARVPGYRVAAKTGTSKKVSKKRLYIPNLVGVIPAGRPRLAIYVFINEPDPNIEYYGGRVTGPVFAEIAGHAMHILGVRPDFPEELGKSALAGYLPGSARRRYGSESVEGEGAVDDGAAESAGSEDEPWTVASANAATKARANLASVKEGEMPPCLGLTVADVIELAAGAQLPVRIYGTGIAVRQSPPPGTRLAKGERARVVFARPEPAGAGKTPESGANFPSF